MAEEEQLVVILDSEGEETQELAAICVDLSHLRIKDVYLKWAQPPSLPDDCDTDWWARKHVHGLNRNFLKANGFANEKALVDDFQSWLQQYEILEFLGHAPAKEEILLNRGITDVRLPNWSQRPASTWFSLSRAMKTLEIGPKSNIYCSRFHHSEYRGWCKDKTDGDRARNRFGYHCALYDCVGIVLFLFPDIIPFSD